MLTLIINAELFSPQPQGRQQLLVAGERILAIGDNIDLSGSDVQVIDAAGKWLLPGFVDALTHPAGGGGEGGFGNRTEELSAEDFIAAGVTTLVGALGTDSITRSLEVLYGKVMQLRANGLAAYMYTGAYRVPAPTLTGDIARDITLVAPVIGIGEVAISDHRSAQPTVAELQRLAADTRLGGILSGKGGTVFIHVGDGESRLAPLREALDSSDLPSDTFYPTHINRSQALLQEAAAFAANGAWIDITVSTTPELIAAGDIPALQALLDVIKAGAPADRVTLSSDAGGSLPVYRNGQLEGLTAASPSSLLELLQDTLREHEAAVPLVLAALTCNPARALGLSQKGVLTAGAEADLLLFDPASAALTAVMCLGRWLRRS